MILQSQKDPRWANEKLGTCKDTIAQSGCKITCYGMLSDLTPLYIDRVITYTNGCLTDDARNCKELGLTYQGRVTEKPVGFGMCIAETDHWKSKGVPQHFFVYDTTTDLKADPLDLPCVWKKNNYNIVSYRLIKPTVSTMKIPQKLKDEVAKYDKLLGTKTKLGDNLDEKDLMTIKELMSDMRDSREEIHKGNLQLATKLSLVEDSLERFEVSQRKLSACLSAPVPEDPRVEQLEDEVIRLTALVDKNAKDTSILDALSFAIKAILNR